MLVASQAAGVLASIVVARSVGPAGRGTVVTLTAWGQILGWLAAFSLDKAIVVLTSGVGARISPDDGVRAVRVPVLGLSVFAVAASVVLGRHFFSSPWLIAALCAFAVATAQSEIIAGWLLASGRRQAFIIWRLLQPSLYVVFIVSAALALRSSTTVERSVVMGIGAAASMVLPVVCGLFLLPRMPMMSIRSLGHLLRFGAATQVANILGVLNGRLDLLTLTFLVSTREVGYYAAGVAVGQVTLLMATAGIIRGMTRESRSTDFMGLGIATALASVVFFASPTIVPLAFGSSFSPAVSIARILAVGGVVNCALQASCGRLLGERHPWTVALAQGVGAVVFAGGIASFPTLQGAAWSSVASFAVSLILAEAFLRKRADDPQADAADAVLTGLSPDRLHLI